MSAENKSENASNLSSWANEIYQGDAINVMREMPESSVHSVMFSPPYWKLRDYGDIESVIGGEGNCNHQWRTESIPSQGGYNKTENLPDVGGNTHVQSTNIRGPGDITSEVCEKCGAWKGQFGLEASINQYVQNMVEVGRAVGHVLREDGSWWLNIGDTFDTDGNGLGLGRKQKGLVPQRVVIALQQQGWTVRNTVTWVKKNPMPSAVKDRFTTSTEKLFHLTPNPDYWFDLDAVREPRSNQTINECEYTQDRRGAEVVPDETLVSHPNGKNPGDVFELSTQPYPDAHFAVYPPKLCEKPIKSSCPPEVCVGCAMPYERESDSKEWKQVCDCETEKTEPGIVLDPFCGSGTTCMVAKKHNRQFVGIDLNPEYVAMAQKRVGITVDEPEHLLDAEKGELPLTAFTDD